MTTTLSPEMLKEKEALLWEEVRATREISLKLLQWSATALASIQTALFFLRKDIYERMLASKQLVPGQHIPWPMYLRGSIFLFVVAVVFAYIFVLNGNRYRKLRAQLVATNIYQIDHGPVSKSARWIIILVFLAFPIIDVVIRWSFR